MFMITNILLALCVFISIWSGSIIICRMIKIQRIYAFSFLTFAIGCTGLITHFMGIW